MRYISRGQALSDERIRGILDKQLHHWREHGFGRWIVDDEASGAWIGEIGHKIEVGWEIFERITNGGR